MWSTKVCMCAILARWERPALAGSESRRHLEAAGRNFAPVMRQGSSTAVVSTMGEASADQYVDVRHYDIV